MLVGISSNFQYLDWAHDALENSEPPGNISYDHIGSLSTHTLNLNITYGMSDFSNVDVSFMAVRRWMEFEGDSVTIHHRDEDAVNTNSNYGVGDIRIKYRYLFINDVVGAGHRLFFGGGLLIPSKHTFTENPYKLSNEKLEHTHFTLSDGNYKALFELQYFRRSEALFLFGGTANAAIPLNASDIGHWAGNEFNLSIYGYLHNQKILNIGLFSILVNGMYRTADKWDNFENGSDGKIDLTQGGIINAGLGYSREIGSSMVHFQVQKSVYNTVVPAGEKKSIQSDMSAINFSISLKSRMSLDYF